MKMTTQSLLDRVQKEIIIFLNSYRTLLIEIQICNKELETIKELIKELDNSVAEIKSKLEAMNSRLNHAEEQN